MAQPKYRTALITGASGGIGEAFAVALAKAGTDLILVARTRSQLEALAEKLRAEHGRRVEVIVADLSQPLPGEALSREVARRDLSVDLLINNAGFGTAGAFHQQDAAREQQQIALNCAALVDLSRSFLDGMLDRAHGGIINVASLAAFQPMPYMAVYAASKAFVLSFSQALFGEYHKQGIKVLAVCPGPVDTAFFEATGNRRLRGTVPKSLIVTAERVAERSLKAFHAGETVVVPSAQHRALNWMNRLVPLKLTAATTARLMQR